MFRCVPPFELMAGRNRPILKHYSSFTCSRWLMYVACWLYMFNVWTYNLFMITYRVYWMVRGKLWWICMQISRMIPTLTIRWVSCVLLPTSSWSFVHMEHCCHTVVANITKRWPWMTKLWWSPGKHFPFCTLYYSGLYATPAKCHHVQPAFL